MAFILERSGAFLFPEGGDLCSGAHLGGDLFPEGGNLCSGAHLGGDLFPEGSALPGVHPQDIFIIFV